MELLAHRFFVEYAEHGVFTVNRRHNRYAEVDGTRVIAHAEASVLRNATLGNVQFGHDLDTRNDGGVMFFRDRRHGRLQHAIDAVLDDDRVIARFDVNIGSAPLQSGEDGGIHQADDRRYISFGGEAFDRDRLVAAFVFTDDVERETF